MTRKQRMQRWFGRVEREVGEATGDRVVEAKGAAEAATGHAPDEKTLDRTVEAVRRKHGDVTSRRARP